jgi:N-acetylmuramoyl-L-alanine amidase
VVDPGPIGTVTTGAANVRGGPGFAARRLAVIPKGSQFFLIGRQPDGSWLQIRYRFGTGWIEASLTNLGGSSTVETVAPTTEGPRAIVNAAFLNVRSGPGTQFTKIGALTGGAVVPIIGKTADGSWLLIKADFGKGWINVLHVITKDYFGNAPVTSAVETKSEVSYTGFTRTTVNLRSGPNMGFSSLGSMTVDTELAILGQSPDMDWWYVKSPLGKGWINKSLVRVMGDYSALPVIE